MSCAQPGSLLRISRVVYPELRELVESIEGTQRRFSYCAFLELDLMPLGAVLERGTSNRNFGRLEEPF